MTHQMTSSKKRPYPLLTEPIPKSIIWGGHKLKTKYNKKASFDSIAESWELCCRKDAVSVISNGEYKGMSLLEYLGDDGEDFPLLIKLIDAGDKLSVQVHPDDSEKDGNGRPIGKTEMWYIIEADPGAKLVYGLCDGVTAADFEAAVRSGRTEKFLSFVSVKPGDVFFIPSGQVHAIGSGILLAEIQQNSDTTYRLYDYGRLDKNGNPRQLHIDKALGALKIRNGDEINAIRYSKGNGDGILAACDKFTSRKLSVNGKATVLIRNFGALICVDGGGSIIYKGEEFKIDTGDTYFIPKDCGELTLCGKLTVLSAEV